MNKTKLTIVTITKNDLSGFMRTFASIPKKSTREFEYVVIDGNPNNKDFYIPELKSEIDVLITESDNGISDAFNKGIKNSSGDYILLLNSGDELLSHVDIPSIYKVLSAEKDIVCFGVMSESKGPLIPNQSTYADQIPHQGMFVRKKIYESLGGYISVFKLRMDYEFILRAKDKCVSFYFPGVIISYYASGGTSTVNRNRKRFYNEGLCAELLHLNVPRIGTLCRYIYWALRKLSST